MLHLVAIPTDATSVPTAPPQMRTPTTATSIPMIDRPTPESTLTLDAPRRIASARGRRARCPSDVVRSIGERLLQAAVAVEVNGEIQDLVTPLRTSGTFRVLTERDARRARRAAPLGRAHAGDRGATAAPRREDRLRPGDRRRLLLRLRGRRSRSRPRISRRSRTEMRKVVGREVSVRARRGEPRRGAASASSTIRSSSSGSPSSATTRSSRRTPTVRSSTCAAARTCPTRRASSTSS